MADEIVTGKRQVRAWASTEWVTVLTGARAGTFRVIPEDESAEFLVEATSDSQLNDRIAYELRRRKA